MTQYAFSRDKVKKVYSGIPGCMCGCKGDYTYAKDAKAEYEVKRNERVVSRIFNLVSNSPDREVSIGEDYVFLDLKKRWYVVYFEPTK